MATAAEEKKVPGSPSGPGLTGAPRRGLLPVYKAGEGTISRLSLYMVCLGFILYTAHRWYYNWTALRGFLLKDILDPLGLGGLLNWTLETGPQKVVSLAGAIGLFVAGMLVSYYYLYVHHKASEFLIQADGELRKVTWPKIVPWFKPETQVWGATYVVLLVVVLLALYVFTVDTVFNFLAQHSFYRD